jgi:predicted RNA-binding protein YlqC (UPF0109 family)
MATQQFMFNATYNLPDRDIGFVIGTKGNKIQAIQRETGATVKLVKVPPNTDLMSYFHITSFSQDSVNAAWAALHNAATLAMQLNTGTIERKNQERFPEFFLRVEPIFCGHIIGHKGSHIRRIHREMGTRILSVVDHQGGKAIRIVAKSDALLNKVCGYYRTNFPRFAFVDYNERWTPCEARTAQIEGAFQVYVQNLKEGKSGATLTHATWHATLPDTEDFAPYVRKHRTPPVRPRSQSPTYTPRSPSPAYTPHSPEPVLGRHATGSPSPNSPTMPARENTICIGDDDYQEELE